MQWSVSAVQFAMNEQWPLIRRQSLYKLALKSGNRWRIKGPLSWVSEHWVSTWVAVLNLKMTFLFQTGNRKQDSNGQNKTDIGQWITGKKVLWAYEFK